jgi:hypothetical protein
MQLPFMGARRFGAPALRERRSRAMGTAFSDEPGATSELGCRLGQAGASISGGVAAWNGWPQAHVYWSPCGQGCSMRSRQPHSSLLQVNTVPAWFSCIPNALPSVARGRTSHQRTFAGGNGVERPVTARWFTTRMRRGRRAWTVSRSSEGTLALPLGPDSMSPEVRLLVLPRCPVVKDAHRRLSLGLPQRRVPA